ncbi:unnamed protein product [Arabidopsis thaliana]|uniref:Uncharacterized protein n=1 Tax=Arabidopsis thaliana TaxID=3702 RepID=A0A5S9XM19_ARATH|nr:unnamed protein product [Arabidopsis thaliana]
MDMIKHFLDYFSCLEELDIYVKDGRPQSPITPDSNPFNDLSGRNVKFKIRRKPSITALWPPRRNANRRRRVPVSVHRRSPPTHQTNYNSPGKLATPTHRIDGVGSIPSIPTHWGLTPFFYDRIFADFLKPLLSKPGGWMPNAADPEVGAHPNRLNPCLHISHLRSKQIHS